MSAKLIDGKRIAQEIREELKKEVLALKRKGVIPGLAVILVGEDPASKVYVSNKNKVAGELGLHSVSIHLDVDTSQEELLKKIRELNENESVHGILVQLPLPRHIDPNRVIETIDPAKDVDGFHPENLGRLILGRPRFVPCTPAGIMSLLEREGIDPSGKNAVILGRSNIVGKPMANLLVQKQRGANATVTVCHTATRDLAAFTLQADIVVAAMGRAKMIDGTMIKPGAAVIDVGINRVEDPSRKSGYRLVGDVDFDSVKEVAGAITPVPGGVGPMTIVMLMKNTIFSAKMHSGVIQ